MVKVSTPEEKKKILRKRKDSSQKVDGNLTDGQSHNSNIDSQRQWIFNVLEKRTCPSTQLCLKRTSLKNEGESMKFSGRGKWKHLTHRLSQKRVLKNVF